MQVDDGGHPDLFAPRAVAVVGASATANAVTARPLRFLKQHRFPGEIFAVNPRHRTIGDVPCYRSIADLPRRPDVAMIGVPAGYLETAVADCTAAKVPLICLFTAAVDAETKARIIRLARAAGSRLLGPNSLGFIDTNSRTVCTYSQAGLLRRIPRGPLSIISQSGGLGGCLLNRVVDKRIGVTRFVAPGSGLDIDLVELLEDLAQSRQTRAVAAIVESISDGERFSRAVERLHAAQKRLVIWRIGGSVAGRSMSVSHTGALANDAHVFRAVCRRYGITIARSLDELVEVAAAYTVLEPQRGPAVGVVTSSGGAAIMVADALEAQHLTMPTPSPATVGALRTTLPPTAILSNPLDIGAGHGSQVFRSALQIATREQAFDLIVVALTMVTGDQAEQVIPELINIATERSRPLAVVWPAGSLAESWRLRLRKKGIAVFENPDFAATAFRENQVRLQRSRSKPAAPSDCATRARTAMAGETGIRTEWRTRQLLGIYGIESPDEALVANREEAVTASRRLGFPVALKVQSPLLPHRAQAGAIRLNLDNAQAVARAYDQLLARLTPAVKDKLDGILVQAMVAPEHEILLGIVHDPVFGPIIACGTGGGNVERRRDISFVLPGADHDEFTVFLSEQNFAPQVGAVGINTIADLMVRLSQLVSDLGPSLNELDINPVALVSDGRRALALDALAVIADDKLQPAGAIPQAVTGLCE